ncbi:hypothetical protein BCA37_16215 [Mycobacterium sp. djl-10]|nr:hypothetical protein BCA37_16215 [Mycobacterium sp. djl-10]
MKIGLDELTGTERAVLLVLLAQARPVPNPELGTLGPVLDKPSRDKLNRMGLVHSAKVGPRLVHELTDDGWAFCRRLFGAPAPGRASGQGRALYTVLRSLDRFLTGADLPLAEVFGPGAAPSDTPTGTAPPDEQQVRDAYGRLAGQAGDWVGLARLRAELPDVAPAELDDTLKRMYRKTGVHLIPEENQKVLDEHDWAAAVVIGDQHKHLIAIEA